MKVTADDIAQLLASSPPRLVPSHVAKAAGQNKEARTSIIVGLLFGCFGMIFVLAFFPWRLGEELKLAFGSTRTAPGIVVDTRATNMSVNKRKVYGYHVTYAADAGGKHTIECFTTGSQWRNGEAVKVRYLATDPAVACVEGGRLNEGGLAGGFVIIFPLIGFGMAGLTLLFRSRKMHVLRDGIIAEVDIVSVNATGTRVNNQTVYKITVSSPALPGGQPVTIKRYNKPDVNLATQRVAQKQSVFVLYDPQKPKRMIFPEGLIEQ